MLKPGRPGLKRPKLAEHLIVAADLTHRLKSEELTHMTKKKSLGIQEKNVPLLLLELTLDL